MKLSCCTPYKAPYPSGHHWTHSRSCSTADAGQRVRVYPMSDKAAARIAHPAGSALPPVQTWGAHPVGCNCDEGCGYVNHHADDNDDRTLERIR